MATNDYGYLLQTTFHIPDEPDELKLKLYQYLNSIATVINAKDTGTYSRVEEANSQLYFPDPALLNTDNNFLVYRPVYRKVIDFGTLPNAGLKSVAHGIDITSTFSFTRIYATASNPTGLTYFPIPGSGCDITVDATNVNITTGADKTAFTKCYAVLEYIKF